ncbi:hypothetical protein VC_A0995 [Vibrio cholerae O1 biovar El Tor str. N16961]|uniref:Uncharacterized protein n=2 Tax=Vibrio cholerae TaxID=666 RepID=Q9KKV5_VIBCH|nr:hypothetical protein VC_A0995 [Vibrio cholerae O1 biovar El Tor str. N16961]ACP07913.1 conserved hypothetical protein [Vibrio cholerae M66-2]ACQ62311.1 hypothetical protein VCD_000343 [Vibrio cholerae MJ-1236]AFC60445.1 hypothetical protein O3Y_18153 [Vibrio cholerae IEC224]EEO10602.1 hypothetical protein VCC_001616 [Vibrio cholerae RC9]EEO17661.1 hypothetical protein VCE_001682 [Vibrio cholerae B33]EEO21139.1 hypothetical protein VCF_001080 [Vibrio cholerae BX 330286]
MDDIGWIRLEITRQADWLAQPKPNDLALQVARV